MILVTGGTGLVGAHLLLRLVKNDVIVKAIHRKESNLKAVEKVFNYYEPTGSDLFEKIVWVEADINDISSLEIAFENIDLVYHVAAFISFDPRDYKQLLKVNAEGTANIVNLCIAFNVKKICHVSTIGTIGKSITNQCATEENTWSNQHVNVYALSKYEAEMEVWRASQEGLSMVIVNPGVIIGPGFWESGTGNLFTTANKGYSYYLPGGTGFITVHDVVRMMVELMNSEITNERFIAVSDNLSFKEILHLLSLSLGRKQPTTALKFWQLELGRIFDLIWSTLSGKPRKITKSNIYSLKHRDKYDNSKIKEFLNFEFEPLKPTIDFSCQRFLEENL